MDWYLPRASNVVATDADVDAETRCGDGYSTLGASRGDLPRRTAAQVSPLATRVRAKHRSAHSDASCGDVNGVPITEQFLKLGR